MTDKELKILIKSSEDRVKNCEKDIKILDKELDEAL